MGGGPHTLGQVLDPVEAGVIRGPAAYVNVTVRWCNTPSMHGMMFARDTASRKVETCVTRRSSLSYLPRPL
jgi:hypothetical protein